MKLVLKISKSYLCNISIVIWKNNENKIGKYIEPETSYCISSKISVKNILLKKINLIKSAFNDRYET